MPFTFGVRLTARRHHVCVPPRISVVYTVFTPMTCVAPIFGDHFTQTKYITTEILLGQQAVHKMSRTEFWPFAWLLPGVFDIKTAYPMLPSMADLIQFSGPSRVAPASLLYNHNIPLRLRICWKWFVKALRKTQLGRNAEVDLGFIWSHFRLIFTIATLFLFIFGYVVSDLNSLS